MFEITVTIVFFPIYLLFRWPYFKLPLGPDTGFYVSNHTISQRKFNFCKGWNSRYAMCSKFIPELFLSLIYIIAGPERYKFLWRFSYSIYNYLTGIAVGLLVAALVNDMTPFYILGLFSYCFISSEPHYGIYYESSEQFEILFQVLGTVCILAGIEFSQPSLIFLGAAFWLVDIFFTKITGLVAFIPLMGGTIWFEPLLWPYLLVEFGLFLLCYTVLFVWCNRDPLRVIKSEIGHQFFYSRKGMDSTKNDTLFQGLRKRLVEKLNQIKQILVENPQIPLLAFAGLVWSFGNLHGTAQSILYLYILGVLCKLAISFLPIWWYTVPLLPVLGIFAGLGLHQLVSSGIYGLGLALVLVSTWCYSNLYRPHKLSLRELNSYTWKLHKAMGKLHFELENISNELSRMIKKDSLFVYGTPAPCAMVGQCYDVNFLTAVYYLDGVNSNWETELHSKMLDDPPAYILDMFKSFDPEAVYNNIGVEYKLLKHWDVDSNNIDLYEFKDKISIVNANPKFKSLFR